MARVVEQNPDRITATGGFNRIEGTVATELALDAALKMML
jgi:hypothetical protein